MHLTYGLAPTISGISAIRSAIPGAAGSVTIDAPDAGAALTLDNVFVRGVVSVNSASSILELLIINFGYADIAGDSVHLMAADGIGTMAAPLRAIDFDATSSLHFANTSTGDVAIVISNYTLPRG